MMKKKTKHKQTKKDKESIQNTITKERKFMKKKEKNKKRK